MLAWNCTCAAGKLADKKKKNLPSTSVLLRSCVPSQEYEERQLHFLSFFLFFSFLFFFIFIFFFFSSQVLAPLSTLTKVTPKISTEFREGGLSRKTCKRRT
ncbi:uncharacterized protein CIMG_12682 [Coccidioides immitis RS]|uniref:Uncharacterized protein n=1 Tax=Coccidioides immitis (strain RS) TaxID=246410 RepID=A0A0D8JSQ2_COCIM|nr:uncharacterized protein CIMG_12682 [Coccidioides immitis RS]KJF60011.1 hypothetical protein CIMG_12682 [Coccidioides immitis RS]